MNKNHVLVEYHQFMHHIRLRDEVRNQSEDVRTGTFEFFLENKLITEDVSRRKDTYKIYVSNVSDEDLQPKRKPRKHG